MQTGDVSNASKLAQVDENNEKDQKRWSSIAGKKRRERLALLHGFVFIKDEVIVL